MPLENNATELNDSSHISTAFNEKALPKLNQIAGEGSRVSLQVRQFHPRLFATGEEWARLPSMILTDSYRTQWNQTIVERAEKWRAQPPTPYGLVGPLNGNGVLDTARQVQLHIKHWAYVYRMTQDIKWSDRIWEELVMASGNSTEYFGIAGDNWNSQHWLDIGEFLVAFSFAYDWLYDAWTAEQRKAIMWTIISLGLSKALEAYEDDAWFLHVKSNWNCVTNSGIIIAALAIYHEDPTGIAKSLLPRAINNARENCAQAVQTDGTWKETPDYWYFGTQAHAQLSSALFSATGDIHGLLHANEALEKTGMFHIYNTGFAGKFDYGDCGPAKITATANSLFFYGDQYKIPAYTGYQRQNIEAADPLSMLWYKPISDDAAWWSDLPLDRSFGDEEGAWVSMRSSWTSSDGLFVAMKAGKLIGHSDHGNLDAGDFVLDALGERWAVELCHQDYLSPGYFDGEAQKNKRWQYYRTGTAGQNTILYNGTNQLVTAAPTTSFESSSTVNHVSRPGLSNMVTTIWTANLSSAYNGPQIQRRLGLPRNRTQVLIQDQIKDAVHASQWRMHTRADIQISENRREAGKFLKIGDKQMNVKLQGASDLLFHVMDASRRLEIAPLLKGEEDNPNIGIQVLYIDIPPGYHDLSILFLPR
ncbi:chondroitin AC/alginate lyase [Truncatella angustata]|uniref:Chondroitin AC/alginate lyase n=1 Tax=Truncatella angustata TaxID=152316 RepID=A0A9P8UB48_9PEZI|nr:chondroitin AC/alginate lyase [Truncatella angustata]KAH6645527.1 chondroitin AC/alginate lyase [Truncatella angustata]